MRKSISCLGAILLMPLCWRVWRQYELDANTPGDKHGPGFSDDPRQSPDGGDRAVL